MIHRAPIVLLFGLCACVIGQEKWPRPRDLSPSWKVDRPRILAVQAEPPEIRPGQTATFSALVANPAVDLAEPDADTAEDELTIIWLACPPEEEGGIGFGCSLDIGDVDFEATGTDPDLEEIGFIGMEPFFPPVYEAPEDLLDGVEEEQDRLEGVQILVQVTAMPLAVLEEDVADIDFNEVEAGYKRLVVSEATTPNRNPLIAEFWVDQNPVAPDTRVHLDPNQSYEIGALFDESLREQYEFLNSDGELEARQEEPYITWYATGGDLLEPFTLYGYTEATWISPSRRGTEGIWYAIGRDRRGGMTWRAQSWIVD